MNKRGIVMLAAAEAVLSGDLSLLRARTGEEEGHQAHKTTHRPLTKFIIKGVEVYAHSRKDALTRYRHKHNN